MAIAVEMRLLSINRPTWRNYHELHLFSNLVLLFTWFNTTSPCFRKLISFRFSLEFSVISPSFTSSTLNVLILAISFPISTLVSDFSNIFRTPRHMYVKSMLKRMLVIFLEPNLPFNQWTSKSDHYQFYFLFSRIYGRRLQLCCWTNAQTKEKTTRVSVLFNDLLNQPVLNARQLNSFAADERWLHCGCCDALRILKVGIFS